MQLDFLGTLNRTHMCGDLRPAQAGEDVVLMGWVNRRRDHGNLIFLDLRDRSGITQVVLDKELSGPRPRPRRGRPPGVRRRRHRPVRRRGHGLDNPNMPTGEIEVVATSLLLLNDASTPPFSPAEDAIVNEEVRLKYRYLDLRRSEMQHNFALRSRVAMAIRNYLVGENFLEIETPFMTRSTPEGARDYLVPCRVHPGQFYALPQSPQIFKQILMISGFDRYFQIARCFRDEDLRADRQPEFTQIDLETTFPQQEHHLPHRRGLPPRRLPYRRRHPRPALPPDDLRRRHPQIRHRQARHAPARHGRPHRNAHPRSPRHPKDRAHAPRPRLHHPPRRHPLRHPAPRPRRGDPRLLRRLRS